MPIITPLKTADFAQWKPLWEENCLHQIGQDVTRETWQRITNPRSAVHGLGAWDGKELAGILHYILHPTTGHLEEACYMQDVFVSPDHRRKGIARTLIEHLAAHGREQRWARIYWLAEANNEAAQNLYKTLGVKLDFTLHMLPCKEL